MSLNLITGYSGTSHITSASDGCTNAGLYGKEKYVLNIAEKFGAEIISNNLIRIKSGYAINQGRKIELAINDYEEVEIDNGLQGVKRCDLIVIHYEKNLTTGIETGSVKVIKGTSGDIYSDPAYTSGDIINGANEDDFLLYRVKINGLSIEAVEPLFTVTESLMTLLDNMQENSKKLMGEADISKIGNGTVKGAIWALADSDKKINQSLSNLTTTTKWVTQKASTGVRYLSSDNGVQVTNEKHNSFTNIKALDFITDTASLNNLTESSYASLYSVVGISTVRYGKNCNRGIIICNSALTTKILANKWTTVATLPSGYRPCVNTPFQCHYGTILVIGQILTNGIIQVYSTSELATNLQALSINTQYII